jgi:hypothetical protein
MKHLLALALSGIALSGCEAIPELAYDLALERERALCQRLISMTDRQACVQRLNQAERQANEAREKR